MRRPIRYLLTTILVLPLAAQEPTTRAVPLEHPVLVVKTAAGADLFSMARSFGHREPLPKLDDATHYVLAVGSDRVTSVTTAGGKIGYMEISVDPGGLMELFAEEIGEVRGMVQGLGVMAMTQQGFSAKEATKMIRSVFDFPYTLENATIVLATNPEDIMSSGLDMAIGITAKADTQFGKSIALLRPAAIGVPVMPAVADSVMSIGMSIDPPALQALFTPYLDFILSFSYHAEDSRKVAKGVWDDMMNMYDGGFAFTMGKKMDMEALYGFLDPAELDRLVNSDAYLEMMRAQRPTRDIEVEVERNAFEYRGAKFTKMTVYNDGMPNPMMPDGEMRSFFAGIGSYMVLGATEARVKKLADFVSDQTVERKPLPGNALISIDMKLKTMMEAMSAAMPMGRAMEGMPETMSMRASVKDRTLLISIKAR